jgi:hypothetical protein
MRDDVDTKMRLLAGIERARHRSRGMRSECVAINGRCDLPTRSPIRIGATLCAASRSRIETSDARVVRYSAQLTGDSVCARSRRGLLPAWAHSFRLWLKCLFQADDHAVACG